MFNFYKRAIAIFFVLVLVTLVSTLICVNRIFLSYKLLPGQNNDISWQLVTETDEIQGGASTLSVNEASYMLDYTFVVRQDINYPYVSIRLEFKNELGEPLLVDLTKYLTLSLSIKCAPDNVLAFLMYSLDEDLTKRQGEDVYRVTNRFFTCENEWSNVNIDLNHMEVPDWWLNSLNLDLSNRDYRRNKVSRILFGSSAQSAVNTPSNVKISDLVFYGRDWRFAYALGGFILVVWGGYISWLIRQHTRSLIENIKEKMQKDRPFVAYQKLSMEPHYDKGKKLILDFMATEYSDPELSLDMTATKIGVSRTKINDVLKDELGYTFTSYLNKLRLTEATRLLAEKDDANIAEIAYSVGYKNVPYFNRLFKSEYGCTPKTFKNVYKK